MKKIKFLSILSILLSFLATFSTVPPRNVAYALSHPIGSTELQAFFDRAIPEQLASRHIAGASVAVVEGGELIFAKGYGFADAEKQIPVQAETTLFRIGSVSKLFTWTAVMQLVEQGKLDLDAELNTYLDFHIPDTYPQAITVRHLLAHTAGFEDRVFAYNAASAESMIPLGIWLADNVPARVRPPGEFTSYSNYGVALAGYLIERAGGMPYDEYIEQKILFPLGMANTTTRQPLPQTMFPNLSKGYLYAGETFQPYAFELYHPAPAASATSTATDMARFMLAYLQRGRLGEARILRQETADQMHTRLFAHDPRLNGFAYGFYEMSQNGLRVIGHAGDTAVFHSLLALVPEHGLGLFVSYNSQTASEAQTELLEDFLDTFFPVSRPDVNAPISLPAAELARFAGSYRQNRRYAYTTLEKFLTLLEPVSIRAGQDGKLWVASPYGELCFEPVGPLFFRRADNPDSFLLFRKDAHGKIAYAFASEDPTVVFEKQPWYGDYNLHYGILAASALLFLSTWVVAFFRWVDARRKKTRASEPPLVRLARQVPQWISLCGMIFLAGLLFSISGYVYGEAAFLNIVLLFPVLTLFLTLGASFFALRAWLRRDWPVAERLYYTLVTLVAAVFLWALNYWNLLGWRY